MKIRLYGSGLELCIGKLSEEEVQKFKKCEDGIDISDLTGREWPELTDIFSYSGPNYDYLTLEDEKGNEIKKQFYLSDESLFTPIDDYSFLEDPSIKYILITTTDEKGCWGTLSIQNEWDPSKLFIVDSAPEFGENEFCIVQGYVYDGNIVEVLDEESGTETFSVEHVIYDVKNNTEVLRF